jgi:hypothetical protein
MPNWTLERTRISMCSKHQTEGGLLSENVGFVSVVENVLNLVFGSDCTADYSGRRHATLG